MAMSIKEQIIQRALEVLDNAPQGMRTGELLSKITSSMPDAHSGAGIHNALLKYVRTPEAELYQPSRGWFRHAKFAASDPVQTPEEPALEKVSESAFYEPFAEWLVEQQECTHAVPVGGNTLKDKWGTPDVIGIRRSFAHDLVKSPTEVSSAEIKVSGESLITAFGQACSYTLFSHRSYIVVPASSHEPDLDRLEALSLILGIGLVLFDSTCPGAPNFRFRTRAARHEPDMFYVNERLTPLAKDLPW